MKRFDLITEADARLLDPGSTVELEAGGHVTPLARDTLRARRVTVIEAGCADASLEGLTPAADPRRVIVGSDHAGVSLRRNLVGYLRGQGRAVVETGAEAREPLDYPDAAASVALAVARGEADAGVVIDAVGIGSAIAANKIAGVRAAMCPDALVARLAREHGGTNVLALGATLLTPAEARAIVDAWLGTPMREPQNIRRLAGIRQLERRAPE